MKTFTKLSIYLSLLTIGLLLSLFTQAQTPDTGAFKPSGHVISQAFGDYFYKVHADSLGRGKTQYAGPNYPQNFSGFEFRRVYLGYEYNFTTHFTAQVVFAYEGDVDAKNDRIPYLKYANIQWKNIYPNATLVVGAQPTPTFSFIEEKAWGYRSVERTLLDMRGIASSNDVGAGLQGKFDKVGNYGYDALIANGTGVVSDATINPTTPPAGANIFKKFYGDLWAKFIDQKLVIQLYGDYYRTQLQPYEQSKTTLKGFVAYQTKPITVGVTVFQQTQQNGAIIKKPTADTATQIPFGFSVFVRGNIITDKLAFFARYDNYNPDVNFSTSDTYATGYTGALQEQFIVAGLDYSPIKNVHFIPNLWLDIYHNATDGVTGKVANDNDIVPRITFAWSL